MITRNTADPARWKDLPATAAGVEGEISITARMVHAAPPVDEVRLAQLAGRVSRQARTASSVRLRLWSGGSTPGVRRWGRATALVLISLLVGGVATAVSGKIIQRFQNRRGTPAVNPPAAALEKGAPGRGRGNRSWRVKVEVPTQLDVSVGPEGTKMAVVVGQALISGGDIPGTVDLQKGASWQAPSGSERLDGETPAPPPSHIAETTAAPPADGAQRRDGTRAAGPAGGGPYRQPQGHQGSPERAVRVAMRTADLGERRAEAPQISPNEQSAAAALAPTQAPPLLTLESKVGAARPAARLKTASPSSLPQISEAALLARALGRLRRDRDPLGALGDLAEHERTFAGGNLRREAALARAEALLAADRDSDALTVLDALKLYPTDTDRRAQLARAELRAQDGRRPDAIADFDRVLASGGDDVMAARALYGRAVCRVRGGDLGGARADFRAYLLRFPDGAHRTDVEKMLHRLGS